MIGGSSAFDVVAVANVVKEGETESRLAALLGCEEAEKKKVQG